MENIKYLHTKLWSCILFLFSVAEADSSILWNLVYASLYLTLGKNNFSWLFAKWKLGRYRSKTILVLETKLRASLVYRYSSLTKHLFSKCLKLHRCLKNNFTAKLLPFNIFTAFLSQVIIITYRICVPALFPPPPAEERDRRGRDCKRVSCLLFYILKLMQSYNQVGSESCWHITDSLQYSCEIFSSNLSALRGRGKQLL